MQSAIPNITTWPSCWDRAPKACDATMARRLIGQSLSRNQRMLKSLRAAHNVDPHFARRQLRRYLRSFSAKLANVVRAWRNGELTLAECADNDLLRLIEVANELSCWGAVNERAISWRKAKRDAETYRTIYGLQFRQYAIDKLAADAGRCLADISATQFNQKGKGVKKLEAWLEELMPNVNKIITVDIPSCFDVISRSNVEVSLPLPKQVVEAALFHVMDNAKCLPSVFHGIAITKNTNAVGTSSVKRSIPQGSALAQLAADIEIDKVLRAVAEVHESVHVASFSDNLIVLLEDAGWTGSVQHVLVAASTKQFGSAATTELVSRISFAKKDQFWYCGRKYRFHKGQLKVSLPDGYLTDFSLKAAISIQDAYGMKRMDKLERCEQSIKGFLAHNIHLKGVLNECADLLVTVKSYQISLMKKPLQEGK